MDSSTLVGYVACAISVLFFGSNFVPIKKYETGDGIFFQWVLCTAIWFSGMVVNIARTHFSSGLTSSISFYPFAMLGGVLWATGNIMVVPIVKCIGLGLGMCTWGTVNLIVGWASGTFLFSQKVAHPIFNYIGVALAVCSVTLFVFVKTDTSPSPQSKQSGYTAIEANDDISVNSYNEELHNTYDLKEKPPVDSGMWVEALSPTQKRALGFFLSLVSGIFYGVNFNPPQYIMDNSSNTVGLDFVFSHFCGIFVTSTTYMVVYSIAKKTDLRYIQPWYYLHCSLECFGRLLRSLGLLPTQTYLWLSRFLSLQLALDLSLQHGEYLYSKRLKDEGIC